MADIRGHKVVTLKLARTTTRSIFTTIELCTIPWVLRGLIVERVVKWLRSFATSDLANDSRFLRITFAKRIVASLYDFRTLTRVMRPKYAMVEGQSTLPWRNLVHTLLTLHESWVSMTHVADVLWLSNSVPDLSSTWTESVLIRLTEVETKKC